MPTTPDTMSDMLLGYAIGLGIVLIMTVSIWWRYRSLTTDEQALEKLETDIQQESQSAHPTETVAASD